jgi:hypothetical protein
MRVAEIATKAAGKFNHKLRFQKVVSCGVEKFENRMKKFERNSKIEWSMGLARYSNVPQI